MRLVAGVLALTLFAPFVRADDSDPPVRPAVTASARTRVPLRVVRVMPESHQALLFDRRRETHVLAEVGSTVQGYLVEDIADDEVVLSRDGSQIVLAAPAQPREQRHARDGDDRTATQRSDVAATPAPLDPYGEIRTVPAADADRGAGEPADPARADRVIEAGDGGVRVARAPTGVSAAPIEPGADGVRVARAPSTEPPIPAAASAPMVASSSALPTAGPASTPLTDGSPSALPMAGPASTPLSATPSGAPLAAEPANAPADHGAPTGASLGAPTPTSPSAPSPTSPSATSSIPANATSDTLLPTSSPTQPSSLGIIPADAPPAEARAATARPASTTGRAARARRPKAAGNRQAVDARALADILSADGPTRSTRSPRAPAELTPAAPADVATTPAAAPASTRATSEARTATPSSGAIVLSRAEVDAALGDFAALSTAIHAQFSDAGVIVSDVASGTIFQRAGLEAGDTITSINGARLRSLDDAANLYARAATASALSIQLLRGGKPVTLRVVIQ